MKVTKTIAVVASLLLAASQASAATLSLSPSTQSITAGETFTVDVLLDTQGQEIDGVDLHYLRYNPYYLQLQDSNTTTDGTQVQSGTLMPQTLTNEVDTVNGRINFSQITTSGTKYSGSGKLATITFKALVNGTANVTFDYASGNTTDTNVASAGQDILTSVTNGTYTVSGGTTPPPGQNPGQAHGNSCLINDAGTYYLILNSLRHGVTNPGMLYSHGYDFGEAVPAVAEDRNIPEGSLLLPGDGALVKSPSDPTVFLISNGMKHGFVSASVFTALGYKFASVLTVTAPELDLMSLGPIISDPASAHHAGVHILYQGTVYWVNYSGQRQGYPSLDVYNSWNLNNDFSRVVPANAADLALTDGPLITRRPICN